MCNPQITARGNVALFAMCETERIAQKGKHDMSPPNDTIVHLKDFNLQKDAKTLRSVSLCL